MARSDPDLPNTGSSGLTFSARQPATIDDEAAPLVAGVGGPNRHAADSQPEHQHQDANVEMQTLLGSDHRGNGHSSYPAYHDPSTYPQPPEAVYAPAKPADNALIAQGWAVGGGASYPPPPPGPQWHNDFHLGGTFVSTVARRPRWWGYRHRLAALAAAVVIVIAVFVPLSVALAVKKGKELTYVYPLDADLDSGTGPLYWPTSESASPEGAAHFGLGLRLLHVFWYDMAIQKFQRCTQADPGYALCWVFLALSYKQQLWQTEDLDAAQAALAAMDRQSLKPLTQREAAYVAAVRSLFADGAPLEQRERHYSQAMVALSTQYPGDVDACALAGLSLLMMEVSSAAYLESQLEAPSVLERARVILNTCAATWQDHAGLLHYITHAYDYPDPSIASQGLSAGIRLADIASASCHAIHMKSHLFLELGNWSQVVDSNMKSVAASDAFCTKQAASVPPSAANAVFLACDKDDRYHALEWWLYGLTQQAAFTDARALLGRMLGVWSGLNRSQPFDQWALRMWAHVLVQSAAWPDLPPLLYPLPDGTPVPTPKETLGTLIEVTSNSTSPLPADSDIFWEIHARGSALVAGAYALTLVANASSNATGFTGQPDILTMHGRLQATLNGLLGAVPSSQPYLHQLLTLYTRQATSLQIVTSCLLAGQVGDGACPGWLLQMEAAADMEDRLWGNPSAPSLKILPTWEMYGQLLLITRQQPAKAQTLFSTCLDRLPNRQACVLGMARSLSLAGNATGASQWYATYWAQVQPAAAPPDYLAPGLVEASFMALPPDNSTVPTDDSTSPGSAPPPPASSVPAPPPPPRHTSTTYSHTYFYYYSSYDYNSWYYTPVPTYYTPAPVVYTPLVTQYPPLYRPPLDFDPVNRASLTAAGYRSGTVTGYPVTSPVMGYPAGSVVYDPATRSYKYVSSTPKSSYWPSQSSMYSEAQSKQSKSGSTKGGGSDSSSGKGSTTGSNKGTSGSTSDTSKGGSGSDSSSKGGSSSSSKGGSSSSSSGGKSSGSTGGRVSGGGRGRGLVEWIKQVVHVRRVYTARNASSARQGDTKLSTQQQQQQQQQRPSSGSEQAALEKNGAMTMTITAAPRGSNVPSGTTSTPAASSSTPPASAGGEKDELRLRDARRTLKAPPPALQEHQL